MFTKPIRQHAVTYTVCVLWLGACAPTGGVGGANRLDEPDSTNAAAQSVGVQAEATASEVGTASTDTGVMPAPVYLLATTSGLLTLQSDPSLCVDVWGINHAPGTQIMLHACNSGVNQQFALVGNTLLVYGDRCVKPTSSNANAPLAIAMCDANDETQTWAMATDGAIHWMQDNRLCLGVENTLSATDPAVGLYTCDPNASGQHFEIADASAALPTLSEVVVPFTHEPVSGSGVTWVDPPVASQLWPSRGSLDWSPFFKQGAVGDCTFMSGMGAVAQRHHELLRPLIRQTAPHRYQVAFYNAGANYTSAPNLLVWVEVDDKLPLNPDSASWFAANPVPDTVNHNALLFAAILEKGYALYLEKYQLSGFPSNSTPQGYAGTIGNSPGVAMSLTGKLTYDTDRTGFTQDNAWNYLSMVADGYPVSSFKAQNTADGLPGGHLYYVINAWTDASGTQMVTLRNPWGQDNNSSQIKLAGTPVGTFTMPFSTYMAEFNEVCVDLIPGP